MRTERTRWLPTYVTAVIAVGTAAMVFALSSVTSATLTGPHPTVFWLFAILSAVSELKPMDWLRRTEGGDFTVSWAFACSLLFIAPPAGGMLAIAAASAAGDFARRKRPQKSLFNAANLTVSLGAGSLVLLPARDHALLSPSAPLQTYLPLAVAALIVVFLVNGVLTAVAIALASDVPILKMVRNGLRMNLSTDGMLLALAPVFVVVALRSTLLLPLLLLTAWGVYRQAQLAVRRQHEAQHDQLTDLPNRRMFLDHLQSAIAAADRRGTSLAVVMLDLDGFKEINDRLGHGVGDVLLREVAARLQSLISGRDTVARLGGDEFAMLLQRVTPEAAGAIATSVRCALEQPFTVDGFPLTISGSLGIAVHPLDGADVNALMNHADIAMYAAKHGGTGVELYDADRDHGRRGRLSLLGELQRAIDEEELVLHFQPKVSVLTGGVVGVEALVRWQHPSGGMIPPDEFMPVAEQTELMHPFTAYVLRAALRQCRAWREQGLEVPVAVNGSARNLHDRHFPLIVRQLLEEENIAPQWLELEITENTVMADPGRTAAVLRELREIGVSVSIDDFGTGYSSLANLRNLSVDAIKIDRSFVKNMTTDHGDAAIVKSIVDLACSLGLATVAEGVEDAQTLQALAQIGTDIAQGYFISRPVPAPTLGEWLVARRAESPAVAVGAA